MKILFLHPNFPAQFKHPCEYFAKVNHDVKFICQTHYNRVLKGVDRLTIKSKGGHTAFLESNKTEINRIKKRGDYYRSAFMLLKKQGWNPDLVVSHTGWGCGTNVKEIWPDTKLIAYLEWWFNPKSELFKQFADSQYGQYTDDLGKNLWERNILISFEMSMADQIIAPTYWQRNQMIAPLRDHCEVIYDGIDEKQFCYNYNNISNYPKITYGTRGMEEMRCFPQFIKSLPSITSKWPNLTIEIAGEDEICYAGNKPKEGSWGKWAKSFLKENNIDNRVKWVGRLDLKSYITWLQSSWCHVYLTQPYVVSWSLQESIFCGTPLVVNKSPAVLEFCDSVPYIEYVHTLNAHDIVNAVSVHLRNSSQRKDCNPLASIKDKISDWGLQHSQRAWLSVAEELVS